MVMYIKAEDPDLPAFYFDPLINPMPSYKTELRNAGVPELSEEEIGDFELPEELEPFLPVISLFPAQGGFGSPHPRFLAEGAVNQPRVWHTVSKLHSK
jgi:hypothetical protein